MTVDDLREALARMPGNLEILVPDDMDIRGYSSPDRVWASRSDNAMSRDFTETELSDGEARFVVIV
jgi:hypothetical protein